MFGKRTRARLSEDEVQQIRAQAVTTVKTVPPRKARQDEILAAFQEAEHLAQEAKEFSETARAAEAHAVIVLAQARKALRRVTDGVV